MIENKSGQMTKPEIWSNVELIRRQMEEADVPLHCPILDAVFSSIHRLDTFYHLNSSGAEMRSVALADCLAEAMAGKDTTLPPIDAEALATAVQAQFDLQRSNFGHGNLPYQAALRTLKKMNGMVVEAYGEGPYPVGSVSELAEELGFDGDIGGLNYYSDGTYYGLFGYAPGHDSCTVIAANWPERIYPYSVIGDDPTLCEAFGYWN